MVSGKLKAEAKAKKEAAVQAKAKKQAVQAKAIAEGLRIFDYEIIKKRFRVVKFDSAKEVIDCPPMSESLGVLVTFGQSNSSDTGMRLAEVCGLERDDVVLDGPIPYIELQPNSARRLKTDSSERRIPLVGAGFYSWLCTRSIHPN